MKINDFEVKIIILLGDIYNEESRDGNWLTNITPYCEKYTILILNEDEDEEDEYHLLTPDMKKRIADNEFISKEELFLDNESNIPAWVIDEVSSLEIEKSDQLHFIGYNIHCVEMDKNIDNLKKREGQE